MGTRRGLARRTLELTLLLLLGAAAGLGAYRLNRPLPQEATRFTDAVPEGAVVLDARGPLAYRQGHLPGALRLWSRDLLSFEGEVIGALAAPELLAERLRDLGLDEGDRVVVYDDGSGDDAPLVLLVLDAFGVSAQILRGGLTGWLASGGEATRDPPPDPVPSEADFALDERLVVNAEEARLHLAENAIAPLDVRGLDAYASGHIAGAVNLRADELLPGGSLPRWSALHQQLQRARLTPDTHPLIYGAEVTEAARAWLALASYGIPHIHVARTPYQGLAAAGLPVSQTAAARATSAPSSSVCWR